MTCSLKWQNTKRRRRYFAWFAYVPVSVDSSHLQFFFLNSGLFKKTVPISWLWQHWWWNMSWRPESKYFNQTCKFTAIPVEWAFRTWFTKCLNVREISLHTQILSDSLLLWGLCPAVNTLHQAGTWKVIFNLHTKLRMSYVLVNIVTRHYFGL